MTDREALLRSILESPQDDLPRLVYADWCEEHGDEPAYASFIRVQCELARFRPPTNEQPFNRKFWKARRREQKLWSDSRLNGAPHPWFGQMGFRHTANWLTTHDKPEITIPLGQNRERACVFGIARGFIASITLDWASWLRHHEAIYWHAEQTVSERVDEEDGVRWEVGTSRIPRPFVATAQPLERCNIVGPIRCISGEPIDSASTRFTIEGLSGTEYTFDRVPCLACNGTGMHRYFPDVSGEPNYSSSVPCLECRERGGPLNEWRCGAWPTIRFVMPEAEREPFGVALEDQRADGTVPVLVGGHRGQTHRYGAHGVT